MRKFRNILRAPLRFAVGAALAAGIAGGAILSMPMAAATDAPYRSGLPELGALPSLDGAVTWFNSAPLTPKQLQGKVVLVDFWTYSCINCIRTFPHVRAWAEKYRDHGLVVIGVHTPEFAFEKDIPNVNKAVARFGIDFPVAVDSNQRIWRAFRNNAWPVFYVADARGQIRARIVGEGNYEKTERIIQALLAEAGRRDAMGTLTAAQGSAEQAAPDVANLRSGEAYLGYARAASFAGDARLMRNTPHDYSKKPVELNEWTLGGNWIVGDERAIVNRTGGSIVYRFSARDLHLVLGPGRAGKPLRFQVTIDGQPPGRDHGADIDADGNGTVTDTRLYQLVRQSGAVRERVFEIRFVDPGAEAFAFTFG